MRTRQEVIEAALTYSDAYEDYPFGDGEWTVMRHKSNQKSFAMIFMRQGNVWINLKMRPEWAEFWRGVYPGVLPAYHMNKTHWSSIILDGSVDDEMILQWMDESFALTAPGVKNRGKAGETS